MRRLIKRRGEEHGAVSVIVAILMVVLLGFAALAIDVGLMYVEKAQQQNGADAAALAIARDCAEEDGCDDPAAIAEQFVDANANDGTTHVEGWDVETPNPGTGTVTVTTEAKEAGRHDNAISLYFANALGIDSANVTAEANAVWGTPVSGPVSLPIAIAECKFDPYAPPFTIQKLDLDDGGCGEVPGSFGWVVDDSDSDCSVTVASGESGDDSKWFSIKNGASVPDECSESDFVEAQDQTVLLPLYDVATGNGSHGQYHVKGFAAFHITAYKLTHVEWSLDGTATCNKCIEGYFEEFVSFSDAFELGYAPDYGATIVRMTLGES